MGKMRLEASRATELLAAHGLRYLKKPQGQSCHPELRVKSKMIAGGCNNVTSLSLDER